MKSWLSAYQTLSSRFGFISHLVTDTPDKLWESATNLAFCYLDDFGKCLDFEVVHFTQMIRNLVAEKVFEVKKTFETDIYKQTKEENPKDWFP